MIRRLHVHNFRSLENFDLSISGQSSVLLIGKNGSGKSTVGFVLEILQKVARGTNHIGQLVLPKDLARGRYDVPMRIELEIELQTGIFVYEIALEHSIEFKDLLVLEERLTLDGKPVFTRKRDQVRLVIEGRDRDAELGFDRNLIALPLFEPRTSPPLYTFRKWLADLLILRPTPNFILGEAEKDTLWPNPQVTNFGEWFSGHLANEPAIYNEISAYLKQVMPDFKGISKPVDNRGARRLVVQFSSLNRSVELPFADLSDGEKCFLICSMVLAVNSVAGPLVCFWDEPDNYLAPNEVGHLVRALRKAFQSRGQFIATSHNPEAILRFSDENTYVLYRNSHVEPTQIRALNELQVNGDLATALALGEVEP